MVHECTEAFLELAPLATLVFGLSAGAWSSVVSYYGLPKTHSARRKFLYSAVILTVVLSGYLVSYVSLPQYVVVPGRPVWIQGTTIAVNPQVPSIIIKLGTSDPINGLKPGETFAYIMSDDDISSPCCQIGVEVRAIVWDGNANIKYQRCTLGSIANSWCSVV